MREYRGFGSPKSSRLEHRQVIDLIEHRFALKGFALGWADANHHDER
jgi:hypothetical protein